jgi:Cdc6-like AAA superfamily ATPase
MTATLRELDSFGKGAAEDEPVLTYFLKTEAVARISKSEILLVLGRKGSGKTALVRHFSENTAGVFSRSLSLRGYPWSLHGTRIDRGASEIEAYVSSWRYLIAVELAALVSTRALDQSDGTVKSLREFLTQNYGGPDPSLDQVLRPPKLRIMKGVVEHWRSDKRLISKVAAGL